MWISDLSIKLGIILFNYLIAIFLSVLSLPKGNNVTFILWLLLGFLILGLWTSVSLSGFISGGNFKNRFSKVFVQGMIFPCIFYILGYGCILIKSLIL